LIKAKCIMLGKRACIWAQDLLIAFNALEHLNTELFRSIKGRLLIRLNKRVEGATGTQDSFLSLFDGDKSKVVVLEKRVAELAKDKFFTICGQTYSRQVLSHSISLIL